jgi:hypothetical membrane protein
MSRYRSVAGGTLVATGAISILGIITAEALYPGYSTSGDTISALGAAGPGGAVEPSATTFNGAMIASGVLLLVAAYALHEVYAHRARTGIVTVSAQGVAGVGVFPAQYALLHTVAAFVTFAGGGLAALVVASIVSDGFRYVSVVLGVVALVALVLFVALGGTTPLGIGGLERWITYPVQIWIAAFGGYLFGRAESGTRRA